MPIDIMLDNKVSTLKEYVNSVDSRAVKVSEDILTNFLNNIYIKSGLKEPCPNIKVFDENSQQACYLDGTIFLYSGLFQYLIKESAENELNIRNHQVNYYFLCWIVAHEFCHYMRGHRIIKNTNPEISNRAFEFDADNIAIELFYEALKKVFSQKNKRELKEIALISLYYAFKNKIKSDGFTFKESIKTHPVWALRLLYTIDTLSYLDCPAILSDESIDTKNSLMVVLRNLENDYKLVNESKDDIFDFINYAQNYAEKDFIELMKEFEELRVLL